MIKLITTIILLTILSLPVMAGDGSPKDIAWKGSQGFVIGMVCVGLEMEWWQAYLATYALSSIKEVLMDGGLNHQDSVNRSNGTLLRYAIIEMEW